jgi:hypothetical protein
VNDQPEKRNLSIWWTCGLPGCSHPTRAGATFHPGAPGLTEHGFAQIVMRPFQPGDWGLSQFETLRPRPKA